MARVDLKLTATRDDHRLTWSELAEFVREHDTHVDPGAWIKVQTSIRGHARSVEIVPDPDRQDSPRGGPAS
jgi:hypothetical protein